MPRPAPDLRECKTTAKRLFAALHSNDAGESRAAAARFHAAPPWKEKTLAELLRLKDDFQLKHALGVVA